MDDIMLWFVHSPGYDWCEPGPVFSDEDTAKNWCEAENAIQSEYGWTVYGEVSFDPPPRAIKRF